MIWGIKNMTKYLVQKEGKLAGQLSARKIRRLLQGLGS